MDKGRVLLVHEAGDRRNQLANWLAEFGYAVAAAEPAEVSDAYLEQSDPTVVVIRLHGEAREPLALLERSRAGSVHAAFVGIAESGSTEGAHEGLMHGADVCVTEPLSRDPFLTAVERACEKSNLSEEASRMRRRASETLSLANFDAIVGAHPSMQELLKKVAHVAPTKATVMIHGESGTGKELIAAALHQNSKRRNRPFVRLNCAALAESVLESELFGHERGAFTGAVTRREGRFKQADGGTLLLDEVSEIPKATQVKLLRFLQEREFERVGGNETVRVDVRIVAATNRDLKTLVDDGLFREDLYYRLNVVKIEVPPLRARPSDILLLADHFMREVAEDNDLDVEGFSDAAKDALLAYPWPGNVRELQNVVEQAVVMSESRLLGADSIPIGNRSGNREPVQLMIPGVTLAELERYAILRTLEAVGGSTAKAAAMLGISRRTIQYRLQEWGVNGRPKTQPNGEPYD